MNVSDYNNYKQYVLDRIHSLPKRGRGEFRKISEFLGVNPVVISQIFKGSKDLNPEQALKLCEYFGLNEIETEYLLNLVQMERAGTHQLKGFHQKRLKELDKKLKKIKHQLPSYKEMTPEAMATFYSEWYYSGIRILSSIDGYDSVEQIAEYFDLTRQKVSEVVEFLLAYGLCTQDNGKLDMGVASTYIETGAKFLNNHRKNWRLKGISTYDTPKESDFFFGSVASLSYEDLEEVKKDLLKFIKKYSKRIEKSPPETVACLNVDWFGF